MSDRTREQRMRVRLNILQTKGGELNDSERTYIKYIESELQNFNRQDT